MQPWLVSLVGFGLCMGCAASTPPPMVQAPMPDDIGWTPVVREPVPMVEERPSVRPAGPAEVVIEYRDGTPMKIAVPVGAVLTLQFEEGEYVVQPLASSAPFIPVDGEEKPWTVELGASGTKYPLIHIRVTRPGLSMGVTIPTNKRLYLLDLKSVGSSKVRVVRWRYPHESVPVVTAPRLLPDPAVPAQYHGGYTIQVPDGGSIPVWMPRNVLDNGRKTFIFFPRNLQAMDAPLVRLIGNNGPVLTNPLLVDSVLQLGHVVSAGVELRMGHGPHAEVVTITRGPATLVNCPGDPQCPIWPPVTALAGR